MSLSRIKATPKTKHALIREITENLGRRHSTAAVLFHHTIAERLGLGPTDHKCLDLLRERGGMSGSDLVAITGLTSGAITGVAARLEKAGYLHREGDPDDGRKQIFHAALAKHSEVQGVVEPLRKDLGELLGRFDTHQLTAIVDFLTGTANLIYRHMALLRGEALLHPSRNQAAEQPITSSSRSRQALKSKDPRVSPAPQRRNQ